MLCHRRWPPPTPLRMQSSCVPPSRQPSSLSCPETPSVSLIPGCLAKALLLRTESEGGSQGPTHCCFSVAEVLGTLELLFFILWLGDSSAVERAELAPGGQGSAAARGGVLTRGHHLCLIGLTYLQPLPRSYCSLPLPFKICLATPLKATRQPCPVHRL